MRCGLILLNEKLKLILSKFILQMLTHGFEAQNMMKTKKHQTTKKQPPFVIG